MQNNVSENDIIKIYKELMVALRFKCQQCGICCKISKGFIPLLKSDYDRIRVIDKGRGISRSIRVDNTFMYGRLKIHDDGSCVYLNKDKSCKIYKDRPLICKTYPLQLVSIDTLAVTERCKWVKDNIGQFALRPSKEINDLMNRYIQLISIFKQNK